MLAYQADSYRRSIETELLELRDAQADTEGTWARLADTVFYPTGGGQPFDRGVLVQEGRRARVLEVQRDEEGVWHRLDAQLQLGPVEGELEWPRRFDHMQQHSGQHLLSALAQDRWGWWTTGFHLGEQECTVDLDARDEAKPPDADGLRRLEEACNEAIREAHPLRIHSYAGSDPRAFLEQALSERGLRTRGLPEKLQGELRLIEIDSLDLNTCGGTHVCHTGQLQLVHILGSEKAHGQCRVRFLVGGRALGYLQRSTTRAHALTEALSAGPEDHLRLIREMAAGKKALSKELRQLRVEALERTAGELLARPSPLVVHHLAGLGMPELNKLASALQNASRGSNGEPALRALLSANENPTPTGAGVFMLIGAPEWVEAQGPRLAAALEGRGGGKGGRFQGKAARLERLESLVSELRAELS